MTLLFVGRRTLKWFLSPDMAFSLSTLSLVRQSPIDAFGVTYHLVQSRLKIDVTPIIAYAVTPIRRQKRANYIGARPQQLRRAYRVQLQQNFPSRTFLESICGLSMAAFSCSSMVAVPCKYPCSTDTYKVLLQLNPAVDKPHIHSRNVLDGKFCCSCTR